MPRVCDGNSDPHDFCRRHFPTEAEALAHFGAGEGPDNRGNCFDYEADHPDYEGEDYDCEVCKVTLTERDN